MKLQRTILRNLNSVFSRATRDEYARGYHWYEHANHSAWLLASDYVKPVNAIIGAIAALSPGMPWDRNIRAVEQLLTGGENISPYGKANDVKARLCLDGGDPDTVLKGPKVRAFYSCIANPFTSDHVVIDRNIVEAGRLAKLTEGEIKGTWKPARYQWWSEHIRTLAKEHSITPAQYQAIVWVVWRNMKYASLEVAA